MAKPSQVSSGRVAKMAAVRVEEFGGPDALVFAEDVDLPTPGVGEVRVRNAYAGLNFKDVLTRRGAYHGGNPDLPFIPGIEAAGVVDALGPEVSQFRVGDRVAYMTATLRSDRNDTYAEYTLCAADASIVDVPDEVPLDQACAAMVQGLTAHYLSHDSYAVRTGETVLVQAAAGGVGMLLVQLCKAAGARVFGTTSRRSKVAAARAAGCDEVFLHGEGDFAERARGATGGVGVDAVFDGVGKATFLRGLDALRAKGTMVLYGNACGEHPDPLPLTLLTQKGSLHVTRPALYDHLRTQEEMQGRARALFEAISTGALRMPIQAELPLRDAAEAHARIEAGSLTGKLVFRIDGGMA